MTWEDEGHAPILEETKNEKRKTKDEKRKGEG